MVWLHRFLKIMRTQSLKVPKGHTLRLVVTACRRPDHKEFWRERLRAIFDLPPTCRRAVICELVQRFGARLDDLLPPNIKTSFVIVIDTPASITMLVSPSTSSAKRGAFIVFEGVDRCGKTTQVALLVKHLMSLGLAAVAMRFPDRTTMVGDLINQYLQSKSELDDRAIHLLFSANRWEAAPQLEKTLQEGTTVICDRYAYSGVAFSSAKPSLEDQLSWCQACDVGLPAPDAVIFLDLTQDEAEKRGGYVKNPSSRQRTLLHDSSLLL